MKTHSPYTLSLVLVASLALYGCSSKASVQGTITFNGKTLQKGYISFFPVDGTGPVAATRVLDGKYKLKGLLPGPKRVEITQDRNVKAYNRTPTSRDEDEKTSEESDEVEMDSPGNSETREIAAGLQTLDFNLEKAPRRTEKTGKN